MNASLPTTRRLIAVASFVEVAERLSFVAAAKILRITPSTLSRRIADFEAELGVRLFNRTTRRVSLTGPGRILYDRCREPVSNIAHVADDLANLNQTPRGLLRVEIPSTYGRHRVVPHLPAFLTAFPDIDLDLTMTDHYSDLVEKGVDVAIRIGKHPESSFEARLIERNERHLYASPNYLAEHGAPNHPSQLARHSCLFFSPLRTGHVWRFRRHGELYSVAVSGRLWADNIDAIHAAALDGLGIAMLADFVAHSSLPEGRLVRVLDDWPLELSNVYALRHASGSASMKARAFIDFMSERLSPVGLA